MDKMKLLDGFAALIEIVFDEINNRPAYSVERLSALRDCLEEIDDMRARIQLEEEGDE